MTAKIVEPDGLKARDRLILEAARSFTNAIGISKDIGDDHDDFMVFLNQVHRLRDASSDEWTWPSHGPLLDLKAHFFDMEEPLNRLKGGLETLHELSIGSSSVPKEAVGFIADSLEGPISWIDRLFWEVYRRQPVVRPAEEVQGLSSVGDLRSVAEEEDKAKDNPPLNPATRERLVALLNEITDMNIALGRLIKSGDLQDYPLALKELSRAMDSRLAITFSILCTGKEEDQGLQERMRTPSGSELIREGRQVGGRPIGVDHFG